MNSQTTIRHFGIFPLRVFLAFEIWPRGFRRGLLVLAAILLAGVAVRAEEAFPGLKAVLSEAEWKRAGLDRLTPDEIGVIDAALIRRDAAARAQHQADLARTAQAAPAAAPAAALAPGAADFFGLRASKSIDWRSVPPLRAKVVKWEGGNRFRLDNGQVWEGVEPITYDLPGKQIEIQARPAGNYALVVEGANTTLRVIRLE
jgi:hypothetical protein